MSLSLRDPIHDYIRIDDLEAEVLQTRPLQRLRSVRQLGLANLVFPAAEHSRFSHALGAMELAGRVHDALAIKAPELFDPDPQSPSRRALRLAALLHDIGHAPFSHSSEELFKDAIDHEQMTRRLLALPELRQAVRNHTDDFDLETVERILSGNGDSNERLLAQIVSGEMDADKMDYLLRDSHFCGVRYGTYDLGRLLETMVPLRDPDTGEWGIGIEEGGVHAYEALVLARYYMFTQVYFNVTGKVLELHLNAWLQRQDIRWPSEPESFLQHDDMSIWTRMRGSDDEHARAILKRDHHVLAFETREHLSRQESQRFTTLLTSLSADYAESEILVSNAAKDPHRLSEINVWVRRSDGGLETLQEASDFIGHLSRIDRYRVYTREESRAVIGQRFREAWSNGG